jgi:hypothetical protein
MNPPGDTLLLRNSPDRRDDRFGASIPPTLRAHCVRPNSIPALLCAGPLAESDSAEEDRSFAYGRLIRDSLRAKEQARAR